MQPRHRPNYFCSLQLNVNLPIPHLYHDLRNPTLNNTMTGQRGVAARHGKMKKTAVDCFNDSRQEETHRLNLKRKMEHDEKMASIHLKKHKYDLRYGSTPHMSGSPTPAVAAMTQTKEDKQIKILHLQIRLAELNRDSAAASAHASASAPSHTSLSQMPRNLLEEASTPSSGMSSSLSC